MPLIFWRFVIYNIYYLLKKFLGEICMQKVKVLFEHAENVYRFVTFANFGNKLCKVLQCFMQYLSQQMLWDSKNDLQINPKNLLFNFTRRH